MAPAAPERKAVGETEAPTVISKSLASRDKLRHYEEASGITLIGVERGDGMKHLQELAKPHLPAVAVCPTALDCLRTLLFGDTTFGNFKDCRFAKKNCIS